MTSQAPQIQEVCADQEARARDGEDDLHGSGSELDQVSHREHKQSCNPDNERRRKPMLPETMGQCAESDEDGDQHECRLDPLVSEDAADPRCAGEDRSRDAMD